MEEINPAGIGKYGCYGGGDVVVDEEIEREDRKTERPEDRKIEPLVGRSKQREKTERINHRLGNETERKDRKSEISNIRKPFRNTESVFRSFGLSVFRSFLPVFPHIFAKISKN
jgi:hypothetical protein